MAVASEAPLKEMEQRILARLEPQDKSEIRNLLRNIIICIKRIQGWPLSKREKDYPSHPSFSHANQKGGQKIVDTLLYRLHLVDRYQLDKRDFIINTLSGNIPIRLEKSFSTRKARILWHLYQDPMVPKYQLSKRAGITPRTITKDLAELRRDYRLNIFTGVDPHKFHLITKMILFETKSITHTKKLRDHITHHHGFLRTFRLDQDMRRGTLSYRYPDQPNGHRLFEDFAQWLHDEFFYESNIVQLLGLHQFISFEMYDPKTHAYSIEPESVSQAPFDRNGSYLGTLPQPRGFDFTDAFWFDQADFLLIETLFSSAPFVNPEYKQRLLKQHGIQYSMKTIWKKEQRLRMEKAGHPMIELMIPGFDEDLVLAVFCTPKARSSISAISVFLPYVMIVKTNSGCLLRVQRPVHTSTLTAQLIRKMHQQVGVEDVKLFRYQLIFQAPLLQRTVNRWNTAEQKWYIQEGDF